MKKVKCTASSLIIRETPEGTDTGFRLVRKQTVPSHGKSYDDKWVYVKTQNKHGWVSSKHVTYVPETTKLNDWPVVPHGKKQIVSLFGDPGQLQSSSGNVSLPEPLPLSWDLTTYVNSFSCHYLMSPVFQSVFNTIYENGDWENLVDFGGCYNYRKARKLQKLSTHSWGIAVDVDVNANPLGAAPVIDDSIVSVFEDHGFVWGGRWSRPDGMHFQYATGY